MAERTRWRGDPAKGADLEAPTAPHAEPRAGAPDKLTGPARFWSFRRARIAFNIALAISLVAHWYVAPWRLLPSNTGVEVKDPEGDLAIPVDLLGEEPPPPPEPAPPTPVQPEPTPNPTDDPNAPGKQDAGPKKIADASVPLSTFDASASVGEDGGALGDAGAPTDAGLEGDGSLVALNGDAGTPGANGPRDPEAMFGLSKVVNAGVQNVILGVNIALIRTHPVGSRIGPLLTAIPQWRDFLRGAQSPVDPVRDTEWILIYGPSFIHTEKDAVLVRYNASDDTVDKTLASIAKSYDKGGPFDAGVPGIKASLGFADNGQRVFLRPQSKLLVIVPPSHAHEAAVTFRKQTPRGPSPKEAMRLIVNNPGNQISIRGLRFEKSLTQIRIWILPHDDGSADVYGEGDCTDAASAAESAEKLTEVLRNVNSLGVRIATHGLLNGAKVEADGTKLKTHLFASQDQLEAVLQVIAAAMNVNLPPPPSPSPSGATPRPLPPQPNRQNE